jgi:hypothetical protein
MRRTCRALSWTVRPLYTSCASAILVACSGSATAKRLIIVTGENPVTIGVLDRATGKLAKIEPPRCLPR